MKIGLKDQLGVSQGGQVHEGLRVRRSHLHPSSIHVPAKFAGRLMGLASFKRKCQCPEYFKNEMLIGKENIGRPASSAGLGTGIREYAKMTIKAFRDSAGPGVVEAQAAPVPGPAEPGQAGLGTVERAHPH